MHNCKVAVKQTETDYVECHNPSDPRCRSIVADPPCPTHRLSNSIDIILRSNITHVRDDIDFLNHLHGKINENIILVMFPTSIQIYHISWV